MERNLRSHSHFAVMASLFAVFLIYLSSGSTEPAVYVAKAKKQLGQVFPAALLLLVSCITHSF